MLLLSGGMDSAALLWWKRTEIAITIDYGQLAAEAELSASTELCRYLNIPHEILRLDCRMLGSGDMVGQKTNDYASASDWWPYRNQLLITIASMRAISIGVDRIWIGTVKSDSTHKDGTMTFIDNINRLLILQEGNISIEAPAISYTTKELIEVSGIPMNMLAWAHSCHKANLACGNCRGCNKYFQIFKELGYDLDRSSEPLP
jgi:7-cyano-7-deazaguanine synthase